MEHSESMSHYMKLLKKNNEPFSGTPEELIHCVQSLKLIDFDHSSQNYGDCGSRVKLPKYTIIEFPEDSDVAGIAAICVTDMKRSFDLAGIVLGELINSGAAASVYELRDNVTTRALRVSVIPREEIGRLASALNGEQLQKELSKHGAAPQIFGSYDFMNSRQTIFVHVTIMERCKQTRFGVMDLATNTKALEAYMNRASFLFDLVYKYLHVTLVDRKLGNTVTLFKIIMN